MSNRAMFQIRRVVLVTSALVLGVCGRTYAVTRCPVPADRAGTVLERNVGAFSVERQSVTKVIAVLRERYRLPVSLVILKARPVTLSLASAKLKDVLDAIVAQVPGYRYVVELGHIVLYPSDPRLDEILDVPALKGPRLSVASEMVVHIREAHAGLKSLGSPALTGDPRDFVYSDAVSVGGRATLIEHLARVLADRPTVFFTLQKQDWGAWTLDLDAVEILKSLDVAPRTLYSLEPGGTVQLAATGVLFDGTRSDVTNADCGTAYAVAKPGVVSVGPDGLLAALGPGSTVVTVSNQRQSATVTVDVRATTKK